jgi:hypothetical protein
MGPFSKKNCCFISSEGAKLELLFWSRLRLT